MDDEKYNPPSKDSEAKNLREKKQSPEELRAAQARVTQRYQIVKLPTGKTHQLKDTLFGNVYNGLDRETGRNVIIKLSSRQHVEQGINTKGFPVLEDPRNESRLYTILNQSETTCPYVARHLATWENQHWITQVLEKYSGGELYDNVVRWHERGIPNNILAIFRADAQHRAAPAVTYRMPATEIMARFYFKQLVLGVHHIHSHYICHRDLSLENVILDDKYNLHIIDLGLARIWHRDDPRIWLSTAPPVGKHSYWSPECGAATMRCDKYNRQLPEQMQPTYDSRANDIWCVGVMLYMMLFGIAPYDISSTADHAFAYLIGHGAKVNLQYQRNKYQVDFSRKATTEAVDLLTKIFRPERERITIENIMQHPFFMIPLSQCVSG